MSRLNNLYQNAKRHTEKIVAGALIVGALAGMGGCTKNIGEEVYRGNINGQEVVYEEGRSSIFYLRSDGFNQSIMTIKKDELTYRLIDWQSETPINWKNDGVSEFKKDELETIVVEKNGQKEKYLHVGKMAEWNPTTIDDRGKKEIFKKGNQMYNDLRAQIREQLRAQYEAQPNPLE